MIKGDKTKIFINELYSEPPKRNYPTNKIVQNRSDEIKSIDLADMDHYKTLNNRGYQYIFILIDHFSKYTCAIHLKRKNSLTISENFSIILTNLKRLPFKLESDRGKEWYNSIFHYFLKSKNLQHYSRSTDKGPTKAERDIRTIRNLLKKPVFEKGNDIWLNKLSSVFNKYNITIHYSNNRTPIQASKKVKEEEVYFNLKDNREIQKPKFQLGQLVRTADFIKYSRNVILQFIAMRFIQ